MCPSSHCAMTDTPTRPGRPAPGLNASHDDDPDGYDDQRSAGWLAERRHAMFLSHVDRSEGTVVELGSGTGTLLRALAGSRPDREFVGIEPLPNYVEFANGKAREQGLANVRFAVGTGERPPADLVDSPAGLLINVDTLHHVVDEAAVAREMFRLTRPGATWVVMEPNRWNAYMALYHAVTPGERNFRSGSFLRRAEGAGWTVTAPAYVLAIPGAIPEPPAWAKRVERLSERIPVVGGAVVLQLTHP